MNLHIPLGEEKITVREKDDSFWFSDKLEDWYGLKPRITREVRSRAYYDNQLVKRKRVKEELEKERFFNSTEAGKYCGISCKRFQKFFKESGMVFANAGKKRYSLKQVKEVERLVKEYDNRTIMADDTYDVKKIAYLTGYTEAQVKKEMRKDSYTYCGFKHIRNRLNKKYK